MTEEEIIDLITTTYPEIGTFQDVDTATLPDGTVQKMFYFSSGRRAAYQTGWTALNLEQLNDIPIPEEILNRFTFNEDAESVCLSDGFWYSLFEGGYLKPAKFLKDHELTRVNKAIETLQAFQKQMNDANFIEEC